VFTPSGYVKHKVEKRFDIHNVIVTPNGVDVSRFHPEAKQDTFTLPTRYILFIGTLQPRKNLQLLLQAWHTIKGEFDDLWLLVAGGVTPVFKTLEFVADERVRFLGYVSDADLSGLYAHATLLVLPSLEEGFGLPALEAMACGTPVIVSNAGALPEVVGDAGLIFEVSKVDDLIGAIREALCDSKLRLVLRERGLARAKTYSWQQSAERIWNTLHEC
jgi:glycosyltransferase involved in cell wall biosynthesis